jgi:hypothetical protein
MTAVNQTLMINEATENKAAKLITLRQAHSGSKQQELIKEMISVRNAFTMHHTVTQQLINGTQYTLHGQQNVNSYCSFQNADVAFGDKLTLLAWINGLLNTSNQTI